MTLICGRCGSADVSPVEVDRDGGVLIGCDNPNCLNRWHVTVTPTPRLREAGTRLASAKRAVMIARTNSTLPPFVTMRMRADARLSEEEACLDILDLLTGEAVA